MSRWDRNYSPNNRDYQYNASAQPNEAMYNSCYENGNQYYPQMGANCSGPPQNVHTVAQVESQYFHNRTSMRARNGDCSIDSLVPDISHSTLTATAKEFKPGASTSSNPNVTDNRNSGAVKKPNNNRKNNYTEKKQNKNRNFSEPKNGNGNKQQSYNNYKKHSRTFQQSKVLNDVAQFLHNVKEEPTADQNQLLAVENNSRTNYYRDQSKDDECRSNREKHSYEPKQSYDRFSKKDGYKSNYSKRSYYENEGKNEGRGNWRKSNNKEGNHQIKEKEKKNQNRKLDVASQRERLEEMISRRLLECLVCCERLRHTDYIWSCKQCFHILHLSCLVKWAKASKLETGWRCPACQNVYAEVPKEYRCYCGKVHNPLAEPGTLPHSCGGLCQRKGRHCEHTCTLLCHPGPCPDCSLMVTRACGCGATKPMVKCGSEVSVTCQNVCKKLLSCQLHACSLACHTGECNPCQVMLKQECHCGKVGRYSLCTFEENGAEQYTCGEVCEKTLLCGNHKCTELCHTGDCSSCSLAVDMITTCPCKQTVLSEKRTSCLDPIPCCDKICNKPLKCGQPSAPHLCKSSCHNGPCPPCPSSTMVRCRCGHMDREIVCAELTTKADDARCEKKCTKKRLCAKHKCSQLCCIEVEHICPLPCNRLLSCGLHRCEETCHKGRCPPCWRTSFQELYCECGSSVLYPPVACGTRPPPCNKACSRTRTCGHDVNHFCHPGPCPPCTVFCKRWCHGKHEQRATIPCHQDDFSCGLPCGKALNCSRHKCIQACHVGVCSSPCSQPCLRPREGCGHPCNQPCHEGACPETPCKQNVKVTCECGLRSSSRICMELSGEYQSIALSQIASKMAEIQRGQTVDITDIVSNQKKSTLKTLECSDECRIVERNRRLAIGLQIRNPDLSAKLTPRYSDYMRNWVKKDPRFCQHVHDKLAELVQLAKQSKQKSRSYSFESMNRDKRHFVHEYCEHFGCDSAAYDQEPNRNVVATALRDKSWLPSMSVSELIQRESGQRKVPGPVLSKAGSSKSETVSLRLPGRIARPSTPPGEYVDYFNDPPY